MRILAVGEAPSRERFEVARESQQALASLRKRIDDLVPSSWIDWSDWTFVNLFQRPMPREGKGSMFPLEEARRQANTIMRFLRSTPEEEYDLVVLVGKRVAKAFGIDGAVYFGAYTWSPHGPTYYVVPHPSGVNRWWNDPVNRERFKKWLVTIK